MKRIGVIMGCLLLCFSMAACENETSIYRSYNSNYNFEGNAGSWEISGEAYVADTLPILYVGPAENTSLDLSGELEPVTGDVQIVYVNPGKEETLVFDGRDREEGNWKIDTSIQLQQGDGYLEFRGDDSTVDFKLLFHHIDKDKFEYINTEKQE